MKRLTAILIAAGLVCPSTAKAAHTSKATCYDLNGRTASGHWVNKRTAAQNFLLPGTKFKIVGKQAGPHGIRRYIVRDTGPALSDGHFDLWGGYGCSQFGARTIQWRLGW